MVWPKKLRYVRAVLTQSRWAIWIDVYKRQLLFPAHLFDGFALSFMIYLKSLYEVCQIPFLFSAFYGKIKV